MTRYLVDIALDQLVEEVGDLKCALSLAVTFLEKCANGNYNNAFEASSDAQKTIKVIRELTRDDLPPML